MKGLTPEQREEMSRTWAEWVRTIRTKLGWTQTQLAEAVGARGPAVVCRWESVGKYGTIPSGSAQKALIDLAREHNLLDG
jgi:transcriptional regulator with XRE-family HTH domain